MCFCVQVCDLRRSIVIALASKCSWYISYVHMYSTKSISMRAPAADMHQTRCSIQVQCRKRGRKKNHDDYWHMHTPPPALPFHPSNHSSTHSSFFSPPTDHLPTPPFPTSELSCLAPSSFGKIMQSTIVNLLSVQSTQLQSSAMGRTSKSSICLTVITTIP